jgi:heme/copper-type cytochrome/quinol oxidase subunit 3
MLLRGYPIIQSAVAITMLLGALYLVMQARAFSAQSLHEPDRPR